MVQAKFEQVGAGVGFGMRMCSLLEYLHARLSIPSTGANATRVLDSLGALEPLLERIGTSREAFQPPRIASGLEGHEIIYEVSVTCFTLSVYSCRCRTTRLKTSGELVLIGMHFNILFAMTNQIFDIT